jgi:hypothetical protein
MGIYIEISLEVLELCVKSGDQGARTASFDIIGIKCVTGNEIFTKGNNWDPN